MIRLLPLLALAGCSSLEVTALVGPRYVNREDGEIALTVQVLRRIGDSRVYCGATHSSEILAGEPFHPERQEIVFDQPACGYRWGK